MTEDNTTTNVRLENGSPAFAKPVLAAVLPCPFCGEEVFEGRTKDGRFTIKCYPCGVEMMQDREDKVRGLWNARHCS